MRFVVEPIAEHDYLVQVEADGDDVRSEFYLDADLLDRLDVPGADERQVVERTVVFLAEHQPVADFPPMVDLADVLAAYDDYPRRLSELLAG